MSERTETNPAFNKAQKKKRIILIALGTFTALTWGKAMFASDGKPDPYELQKQYDTGGAAGAPIGVPGQVGKASKGHGLIATFEQAVERMRLWPEALDRAFIEGPVHVLTPINDNMVAPTPLDNTPKPEVRNLAPSTSSFGELGLRLTSTALFGSDRWAIVNGVRVREGEVLNLQVDGYAVRYVVESIRSREIVLRDGETVHNLKITIGNKP
jgi:hypothetical protein